jgi:predicted AAA+ superfamily ATPase
MTELDLLVRFNPWWRGKPVEGIAGLKPRFLHKKLAEQMKNKQIIAITGPRRTGKSTLMRHLIQRLLDEGTKPEEIMYFSFDEVMAKEADIIERILLTHEQSFLRRELRDVFIFLDEVQYIENWAAILKRYYDLDVGIKFVISGSQSLKVKKGKESLAGRIYEFTLPPLPFREFLYLKGVEVEQVPLAFEKLKEAQEKLLLKKKEFLIDLSLYLRQGSFPELIGEENIENARQCIASLLKKVIFEDIPRVFPIESPLQLNEILKLVAKRPGALVEYQSLASSLGMTRQTASKYVAALEEAFIVTILANYRRSALAVARKKKKAYLTAHAYVLPFVEPEEALASPSWIVENVVACHLNAKFFWRNAGEVDFIVEGLPVEVKYGGRGDVKGVIRFMEKFGTKSGIVVTKDTLEKKTIDVKGKEFEVLKVPLWLFLLSF